jgi:hypothetical protein
MVNKLKLLFANTGKRRIVYFFLIIVIILSASLYLQKNKMEQQMQLKVQFIEQKNMLRDELDDIIDEHDDLLDEYGELNEQLHEKDSLIQEQIAEIRNLIRTKSDLKEARRKIETLKSISKKYIANIDSLLVVNEVLTFEKDSVISVNKDINWRNYKLNKQNEQLAETVNKGSVLILDNIEVEAIKYKNTGREVSTQQAKKTQKIRVCFSVLANPIAKAEAKTVYMQLIDNNGIVIKGNKNVSVSISDNQVICTDSSEFNYKNIEMTHCFEWERIHVLATGDYLINLIIDEKVALQTTLKLK